MRTVFHEAGSRGYAKHGWLTTHHSFSFADYYDPERMGFGVLRVLNDDTIAPGSGFGTHPHENMEIITIPLSGTLKHQDNMGNSAVVTVGEIQVMSAGTGVEHAEFNASETEELSLLQIWILSDARNVEPRYDQKHIDASKYQDTFFPIVSKIGQEEALGIYQDARISLGRFVAGGNKEYVLSGPNRGVYFFVISGQVMITSKKLETRDALGVWDTEMVSFSPEEDTLLLAIEVPHE